MPNKTTAYKTQKQQFLIDLKKVGAIHTDAEMPTEVDACKNTRKNALKDTTTQVTMTRTHFNLEGSRYAFKEVAEKLLSYYASKTARQAPPSRYSLINGMKAEINACQRLKHAGFTNIVAYGLLESMHVFYKQNRKFPFGTKSDIVATSPKGEVCKFEVKSGSGTYGAYNEQFVPAIIDEYKRADVKAVFWFNFAVPRSLTGTPKYSFLATPDAILGYNMAINRYGVHCLSRNCTDESRGST